MISVVTVTTRPGMFRVGRDTLSEQTYKDFEWIVVDALHKERWNAVKDYMRHWDNEFVHIPDPKHDRKFGLAHANNEAIRHARGELIVWLQDFIVIEPDALEKYWRLYQAHKNDIFSGVDSRFFAHGSVAVNVDAPIDIFRFAEWYEGDTDYVNGRAENKGVVESDSPYDFEMNWAATPTSVCKELGGFLESFDDGFGYDNTEFALRALKTGHKLWVDPTNKAKAMNHWEFFGKDHVGYVRGREKVENTNDERYSMLETGIKEGIISPIGTDL